MFFTFFRIKKESKFYLTSFPLWMRWSISYQAGILIPPFRVTGIVGAVGHITFKCAETSKLKSTKGFGKRVQKSKEFLFATIKHNLPGLIELNAAAQPWPVIMIQSASLFKEKCFLYIQLTDLCLQDHVRKWVSLCDVLWEIKLLVEEFETFSLNKASFYHHIMIRRQNIY